MGMWGGGGGVGGRGRPPPGGTGGALAPPPPPPPLKIATYNIHEDFAANLISSTHAVCTEQADYR